MGRLKARMHGKKKGRPKSSFLERQKQHRADLVRKKANRGMKEEGRRGKKAVTFQNFVEEVASSDYSIVYQLAGNSITQVCESSASSSVFRGTLDHWRELNLTAEFQDCVHRLFKFVSLPQVLFGKDEIVRILLEKLEAGAPLNLQPVLELIAGLATDLQQEFYPHLFEFIAVFMTTTLRIQDAGVVRWTLRCLGHLLKILWRPVSADLASVYSSLAPLMELTNPDYIRYLGAEAISFLLRKTKQKAELCHLILSTLTETTDRTAVARLLLESVKAVNGQFNAGLDKSWPVFIATFATPAAGSTLEDLYKFAAEHTTAEHIAPIMDLTVDKILVAEDGSSVGETLLSCLMQIFCVKKGSLVQSPAKFVALFQQLVQRGFCSVPLLRCVEHFLRAERMPRMRDDFCQAVDVVLEGGFALDDKLAFVSAFLSNEETDNWQLFMRPYLALVQREHSTASSQDRIFAHLADVLQARSAQSQRGVELIDWDVSATVDLQLVPALRKLPATALFPSCALTALADAAAESLKLSTPDHISHYLIIISCVRPLADRSGASGTVAGLIQQILLSKDDTPKRQLVVVLPSAIRAMVRLTGDPKAAAERLDFDRLAELFLSEPVGSLPALQGLNFGLACAGTQRTVSSAVLARLVEQVGGPDRRMRELALHSLSLLAPGLGPAFTEQMNEATPSFLDVIETLLEAERTPEDLTNFKSKLSLLQRVDYERLAPLLRALPDSSLAQVPLNHLLGCLYTNFTLLWEPLAVLIAGYGNGMARNEFWPTFGGRLFRASADVRRQLEAMRRGEWVRDPDAGRRVDWINYRNQLWAVMSRFAGVAESKNRELVAIFLDEFMAKEYPAIREVVDSCGEREAGTKYPEVVKSTVRSLLSHLRIFATFQDLKSVHRQAELRDKMETLLSHRLNQVQALALEVLVAYKLKFLLPYKDNLLRLLDDKQFKSELLAFSLDEESTDIKAEHRPNIMPIILRLLYGRLRAARAGKKQGGQGAILSRRMLILQHLLAVTETELGYFFQLVFNDLYSGCDYSPSSCVFEYIVAGGAAPTKDGRQLQAAIEMAEVILKKMGHLLTAANRRVLLETVVWIGFVAESLLSAVSSGGGSNSSLRSVRNAAFAQLAAFFAIFPDFELAAAEREAVFKVFVWRPLATFDTEFIHSPTGLLNLVLTWSREPRHFPLLRAVCPTTGIRLLQNICKVLMRQAAAAKVKTAVLELIKNLVTPSDDVNDGMTENSGIDIVLKEMDLLLAHFADWLASVDGETAKKVGKGVKATKTSSVGMEMRLEILLQLVPHVEQADWAAQCLDQLLQLLPGLKQAVAKVLMIAQQLVTRIHQQTYDRIRQHVETVLPLFARLTARAERTELVRFVNCLAEHSNNDNFKAVSNICTSLNAMDHKRVDEPDFEMRMRTYLSLRAREVDQAAGSRPLSCLELSALIYNCCYSLRTEQDTSLKTNALDTLLTACKAVGRLAVSEPENCRRLINKICLEQIRVGLKAKDDIVICDHLAFLQSLVTNCGEVHTRTKDLAKLLCPADLDADFFENIRHVQLHRRGRAMSRLAKQLMEGQLVLSVKNLTQLLLPVCTTFLLNEVYVKHSQLVEQAIELLAAICHALPWQQYETYVRYYIDLFQKENTTHQRQLVKITTAILNAFHFNLAEEASLESKEVELRGKIRGTLRQQLLPRLCGTLSGKLRGPTAVADEDELILRVPLAVPIVRLLQLDSAEAVDKHIPGIVAKLASFLKSKAIEIREAARSSLCSVMGMLGPRYLAFVIKELTSVLTRGYQIHVLTFTVHTMLHSLGDRGLLLPGDVDSSVSLVLDLALAEMFGTVAEEKDVKKITGKVAEAKGTKSYDSIQILARYISSTELMSLVKPLADKLNQISTFKNITKIKDCLRNVVVGLLANTKLDPLLCLLFIFGVLTERIALTNRDKGTSYKPKDDLKNPDSYLIPKAPTRGGAIAKTSKSTSKHVLQEFGLNLLYFLLKRGSLSADNVNHIARLEPLWTVVQECLTSPHAPVVTGSLKCLTWMLRLPLASLSDETSMNSLARCVFGLLKKFGGNATDSSKGDHYDLVVAASKLLVVFIRDVKASRLEEDQLRQVLDYVLIDVMDPLKQTTAFGLLSAIMGRRLASESIFEVVMKLAELSVQSNSTQMRQNAKAAVLAYIANYDLKKKLAAILDFYVGQLSYDLESGRLMAADCLRAVIKACKPAARLSPHALYLFLSLAPRLVNDESKECRKQISSTLSALLTSLTGQAAIRDTLRKSILKWYQSRDANPAHVRLACHLLSIWVDALGLAALRPDVSALLELLPRHIGSGGGPEADGLSIQALGLMMRLARAEPELVAQRAPLWERVHEALLHSHAWVRLLAAQLLGLYLSHFPQEKIRQSQRCPWLASIDILRSVILDTFEQLSLCTEADSELAVQAVKNLVGLTKILLVSTVEKEEGEEKSDKLGLSFVIKRAVKVANQELVSTPRITVRRTLVFNFLAAICLCPEAAGQLEAENSDILRLILTSLQREISNASGNAELRGHCEEVVSLLKARLPDQLFSRVSMEVQLRLSRVRGDRQVQKKQAVILHPAVAAKRKIQQNEAKRRAKKARRKQ